MRRIFDPFFTSKSTGTGIGLSISKRFVEAVKGSITLENRAGGGTVVCITLPEQSPLHLFPLCLLLSFTPHPDPL
jgi:two-component system sensor histidine kinase HydH